MLTSRHPPTARRRSEHDHGTVLLLFPVAILVVILLGSIAVDFSLVHLRHQELEDVAAAAANDAASAVATDVLYTGGDITLAEDRARQVAIASIDARGLDGVVIDSIVVDADTVSVAVHMDVEYILAPALPGASNGQRVHGTATARLIPQSADP